MFNKIKNWYRGLPDKKRYLEFITALLSIPVLLTVIYTNVARIREDKNPQNMTPAPTAPEKIIVITQKENPPPAIKSDSPTPEPAVELSPTQASASCKKEVGPVKVAKPQENEVVLDEQVCINVDYTVGEYCSVAWSYRLDSGSWSNYTSGPFCFANLTPGRHELDLRVQSTVSNDEVILERNFYYKSKDSPLSPTAQPL